MSDLLVEEKFVCDLVKCKGGCCVDGDAGAPLEEKEMKQLSAGIGDIKPYLTSEGVRELEKNGLYQYDREFGWVTPTIGNRMCAYGFRDERGVVKCGIEAAYYAGRSSLKKPISCHLYPVRVSHTREHEVVNYEPRQEMCRPACVQGKKLKIPAYVFLKEALIRRFGEAFYAALVQAASFAKKENP